MSEWNESSKVLSLKLVFYGPALSGKTTNLIALHDILQPKLKGDMQILETKDDRTLFFDLLPLGMRLDDSSLIKLKLYTVPGQVVHNSTRKAVLSRSDGIVFVADSQNNQSQNNAESYNNLAENSQFLGMNIETLPMVIQFNKRDLKDIVSEHLINERWKNAPWPLMFASAIEYKGVIETFVNLLNQVYDVVEQEYDLLTVNKVSKAQFIQQLTGIE